MSNIQGFNGIERDFNDLPAPTPFASLLDDIFSRPFGPSDIARGAEATPLDVRETADEYVVQCDVPGVDPDDIEISLEDNVLTLKATRATETSRSDGAVYSERRFGSFLRSLRLGKPVDQAKIGASVDRGVLTVRLPKHEDAKPKRIRVQVSRT